MNDARLSQSMGFTLARAAATWPDLVSADGMSAVNQALAGS